MFIGRTDVEAETPILWPPDVKSWLIWKYPDAGKDWGQEENGITEGDMVHSLPNSMDMGLEGLRELVMDREAWSVAIYGVPKSRTRLSDWTELNNPLEEILLSLFYQWGNWAFKWFVSCVSLPLLGMTPDRVSVMAVWLLITVLCCLSIWLMPIYLSSSINLSVWCHSY